VTDSEAKSGRALQPLHNLLCAASRFRDRISKGARRMRRMAGEAEAAELLEFALALPLIVIMVIGLLDFANAYNLKQKLANAAREGARLGASQGTTDITNASPTSVQNVHDAVIAYLQNARVSTTFIGTTQGTCTVASANPNGFCWNYLSSGGYGLTIERAVQINSADGKQLLATRVTLNYPYNWTFGFNHIIKLLIPSASVAGTINIETDAMMQD